MHRCSLCSIFSFNLVAIYCIYLKLVQASETVQRILR